MGSFKLKYKAAICEKTLERLERTEELLKKQLKRVEKYDTHTRDEIIEHLAMCFRMQRYFIDYISLLGRMVDCDFYVTHATQVNWIDSKFLKYYHHGMETRREFSKILYDILRAGNNVVNHSFEKKNKRWCEKEVETHINNLSYPASGKCAR